MNSKKRPPQKLHNKAEPVFNHKEKVSRYVLLGLLLLAGAGFLPIIAIFFRPIVLATAFTVLFYSTYKGILKLTRGKRVLSSLLCCLLLIIGLFIPIYIIFNLVVQETIEFYGAIEPQIREIWELGRESPIYRRFFDSGLFQWLKINQIDWQTILRNLSERFASIVSFIVNRTSAGVFGLLSDVFITLFTMFYFFMDGEKLLARLRFLFPVKREYVDLIFSRFFLITRAAIKGTLVIGLIQGTLGGITLLIFGVSSWLLWGFVMVILAIIPLLGAWMVLVPAGIIKIILGDLWQGIGIFLFTFILVSNIDNFIRPRLVSSGAKMHDLLIFFSTLGGLSIFGVTGFVIGPVIASFFIALVDSYEKEFGAQLKQFKEDKVDSE